ncbi:MAG: sigma-70 family RNA polymerase sigma factor [Chloroflexi bacterium]|nr:sigma-70 family RNA polymerase sigma factor [Chloroflexota bacterium]
MTEASTEEILPASLPDVDEDSRVSAGEFMKILTASYPLLVWRTKSPGIRKRRMHNYCVILRWERLVHIRPDECYNGHIAICPALAADVKDCYLKRDSGANLSAWTLGERDSVRYGVGVHSRQSEDVLLQRATNRDKVAFTILYDLYINQVYNHIYYRVSNPADAEDITQEVFIKAWKGIPKYKKTGAPFLAWLIAIAHNLIVDHYKAKKNHVPLEEIESIVQAAEDCDPAAITENSLNQSRLRNMVAKLKGEKQKVILMRFIDGFSYGEIARALNKSEGAVRVIQFRALKELKRMLGESSDWLE